MKVHLQTYGCQMNKLDTALVASALKKAGFCLTESEKDADAVLINTCSVRDHAEQRVLSHIGFLKHIKESKPNLVVGVIGCMAQRLGAELLEDKTVDIVCGPAQIPQITELVKQALQEKKKRVAVTKRIREKVAEEQCYALEQFESAYGTSAFGRETRNSKLETRNFDAGQAYVRVMHGCDNFCTYCVVPYVRGPEVCRQPEAIIEQIKKLADAGVKQVTLLGQRVNAYKYKTDNKTCCLADLLYLASKVDGIDWIRFVTSYPTEEFLDEILRAMADLPKVCNYLHLPAQSGSDKILRAMNRRYTAGQYLELVDRAKSVVPDIAISGDFIVGFPGETEEDFSDTVELVKKARYKNCFIFKYSSRPGTTADKRLEDNVQMEVKKRRNIELLSVQEEISDELSREFLGKEVTILIEGLSKKPYKDSVEFVDAPQLIGRTATDWIVVFNGPQFLAGQFSKVKITKTSPFTLFGKLSQRV